MRRVFCPSRWERISVWCGRQGSPANLAPAARWANRSVPGTTPRPAGVPRPARPEFPSRASNHFSRVSLIVRPSQRTKKIIHHEGHGEHGVISFTTEARNPVKLLHGGGRQRNCLELFISMEPIN